MRKYTLEFKKEIVRLFHKRAPGVSRVQFAAIYDLSDTAVKAWVAKDAEKKAKAKKGKV